MFRKPAWAADARSGPIRRFRDLVFWAVEGLIALIDERDKHAGEYLVITPSEMEVRVREMARPYRNKTPAELTKWQRQERRIDTQGAADLTLAIKEAREMGDPTDPAVQAFWRKHRRNSTIRISLSSGSNPEGYPDLPELPRGKNTGKHVAPNGTIPMNIPTHLAARPWVPPRRKSGNIIIEL